MNISRMRREKEETKGRLKSNLFSGNKRYGRYCLTTELNEEIYNVDIYKKEHKQ